MGKREGESCGKKAHDQSFRPVPMFRLTATRIGGFSKYSLRKLQVYVVSPGTAFEQKSIFARLFDHLRMQRISLGKLVLPVVVVRHGSCKYWLFARISLRAKFGGRGVGIFVESKRER